LVKRLKTNRIMERRLRENYNSKEKKQEDDGREQTLSMVLWRKEGRKQRQKMKGGKKAIFRAWKRHKRD